MEEEDQEVMIKHACKLCTKTFPCGRSLGGHMRSHVIAAAAEADKNNSSSDQAAAAAAGCYGLRENPKKTWRIADEEETLFLQNDKLCKECGRGFQSWKALFGHMKCHSDQDSWNSHSHSHSHNQKKLVMMMMDSQSDNEEATAAAAASASAPPSKRRRSKRRTRRYTVPSASASATATATTSSVVSSFANSTTSVSEVEQEQEEVAMSLMMLSRDVTPWSGVNVAADESSDGYRSSSVRTNLVSRIDGKMKKHSGSEVGRVMIKQSGNSVSADNNLMKGKKKSSELLDHETEFRMKNRTGFSSVNGFVKSERVDMSELDYLSAYGTESGSSKLAATASKEKFMDSDQLKLNSLKNSSKRPSPESEEFGKKSQKRGKFECTTCNKIFHSYQALGGHRASHKKTKGCFASRNNHNEISSENNSVETELAPDPVKPELTLEDADYTPKKEEKVHECPICLRVFSSGQALGGHKRSHMAGGSDGRNCPTIAIPGPAAAPDIRDLLDLNLPAAEEESNSNADSNRPWWVLQGSSHKQQEAKMVGLMSN